VVQKVVIKSALVEFFSKFVTDCVISSKSTFGSRLFVEKIVIKFLIEIEVVIKAVNVVESVVVVESTNVVFTFN
jgi:hypothetical protein